RAPYTIFTSPFMTSFTCYLYTPSIHDALPIWPSPSGSCGYGSPRWPRLARPGGCPGSRCLRRRCLRRSLDFHLLDRRWPARLLGEVQEWSWRLAGVVTALRGLRWGGHYEEPYGLYPTAPQRSVRAPIAPSATALAVAVRSTSGPRTTAWPPSSSRVASSSGAMPPSGPMTSTISSTSAALSTKERKLPRASS